LERCESGCFWMGVAQITRNRDRAFDASICFVNIFSISPFDPAIDTWAPQQAGFTVPHLDLHRIERTERHPALKTVVVSTSYQKSGVIAVMESPGKHRRRPVRSTQPEIRHARCLNASISHSTPAAGELQKPLCFGIETLSAHLRRRRQLLRVLIRREILSNHIFGKSRAGISPARESKTRRFEMAHPLWCR
jgi:hypothetical protein